MEKLIKILNQLPLLWPNDPSKPGIQLSKINDEQFYIAIHRYSGKMGQGRMIFYTDKGENLEEMLIALENALQEEVINRVASSS